MIYLFVYLFLIFIYFLFLNYIFFHLHLTNASALPSKTNAVLHLCLSLTSCCLVS